MTNYQNLLFDQSEGVATVILNRPSEANCLSLAMARELADAALKCRDDAKVRCVLLTGAGKYFCAGGNLKEFADKDEAAGAHIRAVTVALHNAISQFVHMRAPLIIAVNGGAAGAGFSLATCGDLVLSAASAKFTMAYTAAGLVPDGSSSYFLPRIIGLRRTQELMLTNRRLSAEEAAHWGIVTRIVEDDQLQEESRQLARTLASGPTGAFGQVKRLLATSQHSSLEAQMEYESAAISDAANTEDGREGIAAFVAKRTPVFTGN